MKLTHISLFCFDDGTYGREVTEYKMKKTKILATITSMSTKSTRQIRYTKSSILPEFSEHLVGDALRSSSSKYSAVMDLLGSSSGNVFIFLEEVKDGWQTLVLFGASKWTIVLIMLNFMVGQTDPFVSVQCSLSSPVGGRVVFHRYLLALPRLIHALMGGGGGLRFYWSSQLR